MQKRVFGRARSQLAGTLSSSAPVPGGFNQIESYKLEYAPVENEKGHSGAFEKQQKRGRENRRGGRWSQLERVVERRPAHRTSHTAKLCVHDVLVRPRCATFVG